ncbi:sigma factor-like helix-turn-helix DNA-binding protein [uncultured Sphingomonas sp.]|uniref:RNA polymerase sigma factor n=1 Tax=uncultured Sphingomonas sp. TaxID=158754 RepID=UPI0025D8C0E5|nr:sigma factor-like helix-turn-helix DNA-binding protein [uncultured Sphingomonas sp.]
MSIDRQEKRAAMQRAVAALPEDQRAVFQLCAVEGLAYPEVSARLGISAAQVEHLLGEAIVAVDRSLRDARYLRDPVGFGGKARRALLHRLARWLGSG